MLLLKKSEDTILVQRKIQGANFVERKERENVENSTITISRCIYPLLGIRTSFCFRLMGVI